MTGGAGACLNWRAPWPLRLYSLALSLAVALVLRPYVTLRVLLGRQERACLLQWLGRPERARAWSPDLVIHAVSAGEMVAAGVIVRQLQARRPELRLLLTAGTAAGMEIGRQLRSELDCIGGVSRLPWDRAAAMRHWLEQWSPRALVVVETELWPNLFYACRDLGIALAVVSARLYPGDVWRYRLIRGFMTQVLACPAWIGVQDEDERRRFLEIGADAQRLRVLGNAKCAAPAPSRCRPRPPHGPDGRPLRLLVAGSTHAPEEPWLLDALAELRAEFPRLRLILAPRQVERALVLAGLAERRGWRTCLHSRGPWRDLDWEVLILDRMGQLTRFYAWAEVVVIGGTLAHHGGHNFLEPAWLARPILIGPHVTHFAALARRFLAQDALCQVRGRAELAARLAELLRSPGMAGELGRRARLCAEREGERARGYGQALAELVDQGRGTTP